MLRRLTSLAADCLYCAAFPLFLLGTLALTDAVRVEWVARYDLVLALCVVFQVGMLALRVETPREFATIFAFHAMGVTLEVFKVHHGGWAYPEDAWCKVAGVPLYSGFMYASVGSFLLACWKRFDVRLERSPPLRSLAALVALVYANFFANTWLPDAKPLLLLAGAALLWTTRLRVCEREVPLLPLFPLMGLLLWLAECWGTAFGSWQYPRQAEGWTLVPPDKLLSWTALTLVSFLLVALVRRETVSSRPLSDSWSTSSSSSFRPASWGRPPPPPPPPPR